MRIHAIVSMGTLLVVAGCSAPREVGQRYEAERDLWRTHREARRLTIRPELVSESQWEALTGRFEAIADRYEVAPTSDTTSARGRAIHETREVTARALVLAAQVHSARGDSARALQLYERVASQYSDLAGIAGEVLLASGRIAEARGQWPEAIRAYRGVLERVPPAIGQPGAAGSVMQLPLQVARLQSRVDSTSSQAVAEAYMEARRYYERWISEHPGSDAELEARIQLANVAADRGEWNASVAILRDVEGRIRATSDRDPGGIRLAVAAIESRSDPTSDAGKATLLSVPRDYPKSPAAPRALVALANVAASRSNMEEALGYVERVRSEYPDAHESLAQALMIRGRVLEALDRWPEALETFRSLPVDVPLSEAALQAPLEIVAHYARTQDETSRTDALAKAETHYRDFIGRYPPGPLTISARAKLAQTLAAQRRFDEAIALLVETGESMHASPGGAMFMVEAARIALRDLEDAKRTAEILRRTADLFPNTDTGRWASVEAARLEGGSPQ